MEKHCKRCDETKLTDEFYKSSTNKDGFGFYCKSCISEIHKERYYNGNGQKYDREYYLNYTKKGLKKPKKPTLNEILLKDGLQKCGGCGKTKEVKYFSKNRCRKTGYEFYCKQCRKEINEIKKHANANIKAN